jgi:hypothetical protein
MLVRGITTVCLLAAAAADPAAGGGGAPEDVCDVHVSVTMPVQSASPNKTCNLSTHPLTHPLASLPHKTNNSSLAAAAVLD